MNRLIKFQLRSLFKQSSYYVCLCIFLFMYPILDFISLYNTVSYSGVKVMPVMINLLSGGGAIISIVLIALFCCMDFNEGIAKNVVGRGYTKFQLLISKYISLLIGMISFYIIAFIVILILFGSNGFGYESYMSYSILNGIFRLIAYTVLYVTISFILEKNASSILCCLFLPSIVQTLLSLVDTNLKINISKYWIDNVSNRFLRTPSLSNLNFSLIFYVIYTMIFILLGYYLIKKKEIK